MDGEFIHSENEEDLHKHEGEIQEFHNNESE